MTKPPPRHLPLLLVLVAIFAAAGLGFGERWFSRHGKHVTRAPEGTAAPAADALANLSPEILRYPAPRVLAPFSLQAANGAALTNADLRGRWTFLFLGFSNCPDVCPTALSTFKQIEELAGKVEGAVPSPLRATSGPDGERADAAAPAGMARGASGPEGLRLNYWFVSIDPERDTPAVLSEYAGYFSPSIVASTAPLPDLEKFARDVGVVFIKVPQEAGDYTIDHSMQILLLDPDGNLHAMWRPPHIPPTMLDDVALMASMRTAR